MTRAHAALAAAILGAASVGWLDPNAKAREAARLYADGKYDDAVARYNEALTDQPDSPLLHFNLGDAAYKQGKYTDALNAFQQVPTPETDVARTARVAYNVGNVKYRLGEAAAASDPKAALGLWAEALVAYRRALGAAPDDEDAKFNHELVEQKIAELKKKLEEQQKEKEQQQQQDQQQQDQQKDQQQQQGEQKPEDQQQQEQAQQDKDKEQREQQQKDEQKKDQEAEQQEQEQQQQQQQADQQKEAGQRQAGAAEAGGEERKDGEMTKQEATALLDSQRDQEVQPADITKRMQHAVVGEPRQDW